MVTSDPLFGFLGARVEGVGEGRAVVVQPITRNVLNPNGRTHGSAIFAIFDFAMGAALLSVDPAMARTATVQMDIHFVRSTRRGTLRCEAWVLRRGRAISFTEGEIRDDSGQLVAHAMGTFTTPSGAHADSRESVGQ